MLNNCVKRYCKKFKIRTNVNIDMIRQNCDLPYTGAINECHHLKLVNKPLHEKFSI